MYLPTTFRTLNQMNRLFDEMNRYWNTGSAVTYGYPRLNAYSNADGMVLTLELPGVDPKTIEIESQGTQLTVKGELPSHVREAGDSYLRSERRTGQFSRQVTLPYPIDEKHVKAEAHNGVLTLTIAKPEEEKPRKIVVRAA